MQGSRLKMHWMPPSHWAERIMCSGAEGKDICRLLNTNMKREVDHLGRFLGMARDYARKQGFKGIFFIEPKPCEPTKHQYDYDCATVIGFLRQFGLDKDFKINIEVNHATLAGHTFQHELQVAADAGMLGSIDANRGDAQNGWDTDQFPTQLNELIESMLIILEAGGLGRRRREFRCQNQKKLNRSGRPFPGTYWRHGCFRPCRDHGR